MAKYIFWDLEGVLITSIGDPIVHPDAYKVLERSRSDFDITCIWTWSNIKQAYEALQHTSILKYIQRLIGRYGSVPCNRDLMCEIRDGEYTGKSKFLKNSPLPKDLTTFGPDCSDKVLIEDIRVVTAEELVGAYQREGISYDPLDIKDTILKMGHPPDRVIHINSYLGQDGHSLIEPYEQALRKFATSTF